MNIEDIDPGDTVYIHHHVVEPKVVDPDSASESTIDFAERSAQVTVDKVNEDEETVIVSESASNEGQQWIIELGHLLRGPSPDANDA